MGYRVEETIEADTKSTAADLLATRVSGESIEVLSGEAVPIGEWAAFELRLTNADVFLEGMGRCEACAISGSRHRVRLGTLQFDMMNEVMFERIHLAAESIMTGERTGEVDIAALEAMRKAELAPRPSPSTSPSVTPPKIPAPMSTPSWRPPPPVRSRPNPSAPRRPRTPTIRAAAAPTPRSQLSNPSAASSVPATSSAPATSEPPSAESLAPINTTKTDMSSRAEFSPSAYPPLPRPPRAPVLTPPVLAPVAPPVLAPPVLAPPVLAPVAVEPVTPPEPVAAKPRTVSGFPAPPAEPVVDTPRSAPSFRPSPPKNSRVVPKKGEAGGTSRERLEPLLLAMRRGGAARHLEDAEELAMELGLQALERIFGD